MATTLSPPETVAELLDRLGGIAPERVRWQPLPGTATERDLLHCLEHDKRLCELLDGTLVEKPTGHKESSLAVWLAFFIGQYLDQHPLGQLYGADGPFRLRRGRVRVPDLAYVSFARLPAGPEADKPIASWVPDLAVEILSRSNTRKEMTIKVAEYFQACVRRVWLVDPKSKTIRVHCDPQTMELLTEKDTLDGEDVLPGFRLPLTTLFAKIEGKRTQ